MTAVQPLCLTPIYFAEVFDEPDRLLDEAERGLAEVDFDTIVVTGLSGVVFGSLLARRLDKHLAVVRKPDDLSNHSSHRVEGYIGRRWLFVDDFQSSGRTYRYVLEQVARVREPNFFYGPHETTHVGMWAYIRGQLQEGCKP